MSPVREFRYRVPVHLIQVEANRDPAFRSEVCRHKETRWIVFDQATLFAQARLARERDHAVAVMVEEIVGEDPFANAKSDVLIAGALSDDFRERLADFDQASAALG